MVVLKSRKLWVLPAIAIVAVAAFYFGRLSVIGIDVLCSSSFRPARPVADMTDVEGRYLPAGTIIDYRSCEKVSRARFEFLIDLADPVSLDVDAGTGSPSYSLYSNPK